MHTLVFVRREPHGAGVYSFTFRPSVALEWQAGQSIRIELQGFYGPEERRFTISSAPSSGEITVSTRVSDSFFKQALVALQPGDTVKAHDIRGSFVWKDTSLPVLLLGSGMGITPFHAMVGERIALGQSTGAILLHAARKGELLFAQEFSQWAQSDDTLDYRPLEGQRLTASLVCELLPDIHKYMVYISGPTSMVDEVSDGLQQRGLFADQVHKDWFTGRLQRDD